MKLAHVPKVVTQLAALGYSGDRLTLIAILEIVGVALFLVRSTRALGLLLLSAFLGGAMAAHVQHGEIPFQPAMVLVLLWLGTWLRHPVVLWSLQDEEQLAPGQEGALSHRLQPRANASSSRV